MNVVVAEMSVRPLPHKETALRNCSPVSVMFVAVLVLSAKTFHV